MAVYISYLHANNKMLNDEAARRRALMYAQAFYSTKVCGAHAATSQSIWSVPPAVHAPPTDASGAAAARPSSVPVSALSYDGTPVALHVNPSAPAVMPTVTTVSQPVGLPRDSEAIWQPSAQAPQSQSCARVDSQKNADPRALRSATPGIFSGTPQVCIVSLQSSLPSSPKRDSH